MSARAERVGGWRARIGVITPDDAINDDEYWQYVPEGVVLLVTRYRTAQRFDPISRGMVDAYAELGPIADAAETLRITRPDAIAFCCNSCSFVRGLSGDHAITRAIEASGGAKAVTISSAQLAALRALGATSVAIGAPYPDEVTELLRRFLEESGFRVTAARSLGLTSEWEIGNAPQSVWADLARECDTPDADSVLLACSGIRTSAILEPLERELQKPVISAPAVVMWRALRLAGVDALVGGRGLLFEKP